MVGFMPCAEGDEDEFRDVAMFIGEVEGMVELSWSMSMFSGVGGCSSREEGVEIEDASSSGADSLDFEYSLNAAVVLLFGAFAPNQLQTAFIFRSLHPKEASVYSNLRSEAERNKITKDNYMWCLERLNYRAAM